eukprot:scaffold556_cov221-Pinguiococcus_pyrenoidosus.AAC.8
MNTRIRGRSAQWARLVSSRNRCNRRYRGWSPSFGGSASRPSNLSRCRPESAPDLQTWQKCLSSSSLAPNARQLWSVVPTHMRASCGRGRPSCLLERVARLDSLEVASY